MSDINGMSFPELEQFIFTEYQRRTGGVPTHVRISFGAFCLAHANREYINAGAVHEGAKRYLVEAVNYRAKTLQLIMPGGPE